MAYLAAKDVRSIEDRFYELLYDAPGTKEDKQAFFQRMMKVLVPKTNYEVMWERLVGHLGRGAAGEAVFDYVLTTADEHLKRLVVTASRGQGVKLHSDEPATVMNIFWENGNLRRIGQHLVRHIVQTGWLRQPATKPRGKIVTTPPYLPLPEEPPKPVMQFPYDVALSYASEQREYVRRVYNRLIQLGVRVFYDEGEAVSLWGENLEPYLEKVFSKMARLSVVFVSKDYVSKPWPLHEAKGALARAVQQKGMYVLPVRFDDSELPGLLSDTKYLRAEDHSPEQIAELIALKLRDLK